MKTPIMISSVQNPRVKNLLLLQSKARERARQGLFVIEGEREISRALAGGYKTEACFFCREKLSSASEATLDSLPGDTAIFEVSSAVFSKIAYREDSDGLIATAFTRELKPQDLKLRKDPLVLVLESVEKPGNLGAVLRTADAAGLDAVFICDPKTDIYNPNAVRASLGCLFTANLTVCTSSEAIEYLKKNGIRIFAAALQDSVPYHLEDYRTGTAFVMGTEADGLSSIWRQESDRTVRIPMLGIADSLNVSVSAAVLVYEALRQRSLIS